MLNFGQRLHTKFFYMYWILLQKLNHQHILWCFSKSQWQRRQQLGPCLFPQRSKKKGFFKYTNDLLPNFEWKLRRTPQQMHAIDDQIYLIELYSEDPECVRIRLEHCNVASYPKSSDIGVSWQFTAIAWYTQYSTVLCCTVLYICAVTRLNAVLPKYLSCSLNWKEIWQARKSTTWCGKSIHLHERIPIYFKCNQNYLELKRSKWIFAVCCWCQFQTAELLAWTDGAIA